MKVTQTSLSGALLLEPKVFGDERGFFLETYSERVFHDLGITEHFVQDNHSYSGKNVLRGLHYQIRHAQGKLIRVVQGEIFDVCVDLRRASPTFGKWEGVTLSGENKHLFWIPAGLAHGFLVRSESAHVLYKATDFYYPQFERTLAWDDPKVAIEWNLREQPIVSSKDALGAALRDAELPDL